MPGAIPKMTCGGCGKSVPWKPEYAGKRLRCKCGFAMVGPAAAPAPAGGAQPPPVPAAKAAAVAARPAAPAKAAPLPPLAGGDDFANLMAEAEEYALAAEPAPAQKPSARPAPRQAAGAPGQVSLAARIHGAHPPPNAGYARTAGTPGKAVAVVSGVRNTARIVRGVLNIVFGTIFIIGGLSGYLVLIGTSSGIALAVVGALLIAWGIYRIATARA